MAADHNIEIERREKVFFPGSGITKGDLIDYYGKIAEVMLLHLKDRPIVMQRFPDGIDEEGFYHKDVPGHFPDWIKTVEVPKKEGGSIQQMICEKQEDLIYIANQGCITIHSFLSRKDALQKPDKIIFDFDPSRKQDREGIRIGALKLKELLNELDITPFLMTTGSRGFHVVVPIRPRHEFDRVRELSKKLADYLAEENPAYLTTAQRKSKRKDLVFIDINRNAYAQTGVTPYSVRPAENAPVATPLSWEELEKEEVDPQKYNISNLFRRLGQREDPWKTFNRHRVELENLEDLFDKFN